MAQIRIPYGKSEQILNVSDDRLLAVLQPAASEITGQDQSGLVRNALENPVDSPRLCELSRGKKQIVIITSDHTRPVPSRITMPLLLEEIRRNNPDAGITILIATGMHRPTTDDELREKLGDSIVEQEKIVVHKAEKEEDMAYFGILPSGGELWLNCLVKEADLVVAEGFVEPHFFAGFSGGRKSILPGIAAKRTVLYNHNARFVGDEKARQGNLKDNPIHRDMLFAAKAAKLSFILNVLIDEKKCVKAAFAGNLESAHEAGCQLCRKWTGVKAAKADIAITSNGGYPLDQNMYQAVKGMTAAEATVRKGGIIIMCAQLCDGHGGEDFYHWFADRKCAEEVAADICSIPPENTHMDQWEAQVLARVLCKAGCIVVTEEKNRTMIEDMHMDWAPDVNTALAKATQVLGKMSTVSVVPDGVGVIVEP